MAVKNLDDGVRSLDINATETAKKDFADEQIDAFQSIADDFFSKWVALAGCEGIQNLEQVT
jgi:hypothetical protein